MITPLAFKFIYGLTLLATLIIVIIYMFTNNANHMRVAIKAHVMLVGIFAMTVIYNFGFNGLYFFITATVVLTALFIVIQKANYCSFRGRMSRFEKFFTLLNYCPKCDGNKKLK